MADGLATGLALTSDLSFGMASVSAPRISAVATANVILFMVLLLVRLLNVIAERGRSAFPSTSTGQKHENMSQIGRLALISLHSLPLRRSGDAQKDQMRDDQEDVDQASCDDQPYRLTSDEAVSSQLRSSNCPEAWASRFEKRLCRMKSNLLSSRDSRQAHIRRSPGLGYTFPDTRSA